MVTTIAAFISWAVAVWNRTPTALSTPPSSPVGNDQTESSEITPLGAIRDREPTVNVSYQNVQLFYCLLL